LIIDAKQNVTAIEYFRRSTRTELDQATLQVTRQQERVRSQLRKKEEAMEGTVLQQKQNLGAMAVANTMVANGTYGANASTTATEVAPITEEEEAVAAMIAEEVGDDEDFMTIPEDLDEEEGLKIVGKLQKMEASILLECRRREDAAGRLRSRADKLRSLAGEPLKDAFT
jgi:hypothetical protein